MNHIQELDRLLSQEEQDIDSSMDSLTLARAQSEITQSLGLDTFNSPQTRRPQEEGQLHLRDSLVHINPRKRQFDAHGVSYTKLRKSDRKQLKKTKFAQAVRGGWSNNNNNGAQSSSSESAYKQQFGSNFNGSPFLNPNSQRLGQNHLEQLQLCTSATKDPAWQNYGILSQQPEFTASHQNVIRGGVQNSKALSQFQDKKNETQITRALPTENQAQQLPMKLSENQQTQNGAIQDRTPQKTTQAITFSPSLDDTDSSKKHQSACKVQIYFPGQQALVTPPPAHKKKASKAHREDQSPSTPPSSCKHNVQQQQRKYPFSSGKHECISSLGSPASRLPPNPKKLFFPSEMGNDLDNPVLLRVLDQEDSSQLIRKSQKQKTKKNGEPERQQAKTEVAFKSKQDAPITTVPSAFFSHMGSTSLEESTDKLGVSFSQTANQPQVLQFARHQQTALPNKMTENKNQNLLSPFAPASNQFQAKTPNPVNFGTLSQLGSESNYTRYTAKDPSDIKLRSETPFSLLSETMSNAQVVSRQRQRQVHDDSDLLAEDDLISEGVSIAQGTCQDRNILEESSISQTVTFSNPDNAMDRFIPCRMKENLQAKFEAASQNQGDLLSMAKAYKEARQAQNAAAEPSQANQEATARRGTNNTSSAALEASNVPYNNIFGGVTTAEHVSNLASNQASIDNLNLEARVSQQNESALDSRAPVMQRSVSVPVAPTVQTTIQPPTSNEANTGTVSQASEAQQRLQSYNNMLETSIFFDKEVDIANGQSAHTNLTKVQVNDSKAMPKSGATVLPATGASTTDQTKTADTQAVGILGSSKILHYRPLSSSTQLSLRHQKSSCSKNQKGKVRGSLLGFCPDAGTATRGGMSNPLSILESSNNLLFNMNNAGNSLGGSVGGQDDFLVNKIRKIPAQPFRVLDAPNLCDDFYLNLMDWSSENQLGVALDRSVYIWNANTESVTELVRLGDLNQVTSLAWSQQGRHLSVGTLDGQLQIWDVNKEKMVRSMRGHTHRVGACAWSNSLVASGSKDKSILVRDVRCPGDFTQQLVGHRQEVCGLRWSYHDENMLASGGNDNKLMIWQTGHEKYNQSGQAEPIARFSQHQAAVKAINWSPLHRGLLATGGGTADQHIRFWNTLTLQPLAAINTGSQVCNLVFSKTNDELVSTHGYSLNQVIVWKYPTMEKIATLTGHTYRVLYLAMSPDGSSIVTGAGDETLRFWNIFPKSRSSRGLCSNGIVGTGTSQLFPTSRDFR